MKRTRKTGGFSHTFAVRRNAVERVNSLTKKGNTRTNAIELVARELECHPGTIYNWIKKTTHTTDTGVHMADTLPISLANGAKPRITGVNLHVPGKGDITLDHEMLTKISTLAGFTS